MYDDIAEYAIEKVRYALDTDDKVVREERLNEVYADVFEHFEEKYPDAKAAMTECPLQAPEVRCKKMASRRRQAC